MSIDYQVLPIMCQLLDNRHFDCSSNTDTGELSLTLPDDLPLATLEAFNAFEEDAQKLMQMVSIFYRILFIQY